MNKNDYREDLIKSFPKLPTDGAFNIIFEPGDEDSNKIFNCVAYTLSFNEYWIWPGNSGVTYFIRESYGEKNFKMFWPVGVRNDTSLEAFTQLYTLFGYEPCNNITFDSNYQKVIVYGFNAKEVTHVAVINDGFCTSKMGAEILLNHHPDSLVGEVFGDILIAFKRKLDNVYDNTDILMNHGGRLRRVSLASIDW